MSYKIIELDSALKPYENDIKLRMDLYHKTRKELLEKNKDIVNFASGADYFGFHRTNDGWVYREWAPGAEKMYLMGDMNKWNPTSLPMTKKENGIFELYLKGKDYLYDGCKVKAVVIHNGEKLERIPLYIHRVVQDPETIVWCGEIVDEEPYVWHDSNFKMHKKPFIYECHIGMAEEEQKVGTFNEFTENILPRIKDLGYDTIQIMAIMEHPYYGSFGYQVSNFFAVSSRFGKPNELKHLIDTAHSLGIGVLLDVIHSHAVKNTAEGINEFDGTDYQFFHSGEKGEHPAWGTKLFNYGKHEVIHFLLSNLKYWQDEFHFDGFRFDGVTSMLYHDHGLGIAFTDYSKYFSLNTDVEAITYLQLANELIHKNNPYALTIAEDMSGMPGMCLPIEDGGIGFDYRLTMGVPDMWIKLLKTQKDEDWNMHYIYYELTGRRPKEKCIGYAESHDQALVGDKTIMFWLCDKEMYTHMSKLTQSLVIDRGIALHKMIRLITLSLAGEGYLNFMGNEFGHPEWIDFPREGNNWSYYYCRRQWHLADDSLLKYQYLQKFDKAMISFAKENNLFDYSPVSLYIDDDKHIIIYSRGDILFAFNFHPVKSFDSYVVKTMSLGNYHPILTTDNPEFGGFSRIKEDITYFAEKQKDGTYGFKVYLPSRTAICFKKLN